ncbi:MAG: M1 family metallopeptidase [Janthinobacterium lividum]
MKLRYLALLLLATAAHAQIPVEPGVSQQLAEARKLQLSQVSYTLRLTVPANKAELIAGFETVEFTLKDTSQPVQLDFKAPAGHLRSLKVNGQPVPIDYRHEHLVLPARALRTGRNVAVIDFRAGDLSLNRNNDYLYTLLVPDRARTVFPVFEQPDLKAVFTLELTVPAGWQAVANAPLRDSVRAGNAKTYRFVPSDTISTYLFSFVAGHFKHLAQVAGGHRMNFYHRETDSAKIRLSVPAVFGLHAQALAFMQEYTGIKYPFRKFDFTAIPDFQYGGMEHVGAIDYKAATLFLDQGATRDQELARRNLLFHETAHQWFGDLVTMRWFNDVWMKEVFANFMADKIGEPDTPPEEAQLKFLTDHAPAAYAVDRTAGANPIRQPLANLQDAGSLYGNIIYHKAPIMLRQLELLMGEKQFRAGVQEYLQKYAHGNATWPDLIATLDAHTPADLVAWNRVWVEQPGRPVFSYGIHMRDSASSGVLLIQQRAEDHSDHVWPQSFDVELLYTNGKSERKSVHMTKNLERIELAGLPQRILFNSQGLGYGVFPVDDKAAPNLASLADPVARASAYISLYENLLLSKNQHFGNESSPQQLLAAYQAQLPREDADLNIKLLTGQISDIFWKFIRPEQRAALAPALEDSLWQAMLAARTPGAQKLFFKAYQSIALTPAAQARLYEIWHTQQPPAQVKLTEDDYTSLALALAVRDYPAAAPILPQELTRIKNPDRRLRLQFLLPALSPNVAVRDQFFAGLKQEKNREKEAWVTAALGYLHHPLRQSTSAKYLPASLELLQEIQLTGDIFFPAAWLQATLGYYQTPGAAWVVRQFLAAHPKYNAPLRAKLLQAADDLFRAEKM